jgi:P27 family predicted phage terminase small subunit
MAKPGPKPAPNLTVVREGNPQNRPKDQLEKGVKLPPAELVEPDWEQLLPAGPPVRVPRKKPSETKAEAVAREDAVERRRVEREETVRVRADASAAWSTVVRHQTALGLLASLDVFVLADFAVCWARIQQCERYISATGLQMRSERGWTRNGAIVSAKAYRDQLKFYVGELGLSPVARDGFTPAAPTGGAGDGPAPELGWDA